MLVVPPTELTTNRLRLRFAVATLAATLVLIPHFAWAQAVQAPAKKNEAAPGTAHHEHDGFYFRISFGLGEGSSRSDTSDDSLLPLPREGNPFRLGATFSLAMGVAVTENAILFGEYVLLESEAYEEWISQNIAHKERNVASTHGLGVGLAYYLMPTNVHISTSIRASKMNRASFDFEEPGWGIGAGLKVGKEWWLSKDWGVGVYGAIDYARMKDKAKGPSNLAMANPTTGEGDRATWETLVVTLLGFSATCN